MAFPDAWVAAGLSVRFRRGGERFRPRGAAHHRALKKLLQEAGIVPWMRSRIPLLYRDDELVGVGDLWVCDAAREGSGGEKAWQVRWSEHPPLR
ncbi:MAG: tRNA lysidine(34) synthetase TilS, partial [Gammaproteobacteria bacterium]|nr:tRNA lysidine(34) synthetase TilS [Gammaproteobacteria bacterium]